MEKIKKLRNIFEKFKIDGYLIPKNDEYFCEYVSDFNLIEVFNSYCALAFL